MSIDFEAPKVLYLSVSERKKLLNQTQNNALTFCPVYYGTPIISLISHNILVERNSDAHCIGKNCITNQNVDDRLLFRVSLTSKAPKLLALL